MQVHLKTEIQKYTSRVEKSEILRQKKKKKKNGVGWEVSQTYDHQNKIRN